MITAGLKVAGLLAAGTGLGAVLASFADPVPRESNPAPTQLSARPEFSGTSSLQFVDMGPEDLGVPSPPATPDSYAPAWAADHGEGVWQYPQPSPATWEPVRSPSVAELDAQLEEDAAILDTGAESARIATSAAAVQAEPAAAPGADLAALY